MNGTLHIIFSLRAEGTQRLVLGLVERELAQADRDAAVVVLTDDDAQLQGEFARLDVPLRVGIGWTGRDYLRLWRLSRGLFDEIRPTGVICYALGPHVPLAARARRAGVPFIVHIGNAPPSSRIARAKIGLQLRAGRRSVTGYAACSEYVRAAAVAAYGLPPSSVETVLNGIDLERFLELRARRVARGDSTFTIGMVGSLESHKGQATLIRALQVIRSDGVDAKLVLIGSGRNEPMLRALASELEVDAAVIFRGAVTDVAQELIALDVFAYSVTDQEGLGIALVEAMAAGLPVVASAVGACREVLEEGRLGRLVAGDDPRIWARELLEGRADAPATAGSLARFDIGQTSKAYDRLLGY